MGTHGSRPLALEAYEDGFKARTVRNEYGSWFDFVATMGDLTPAEAEVRSHIGAFLGQLETTPMTRSYKMLVHLAMLGDDAFPGPLDLGRLTERFADLARRYASIRQDLGETLDDPAALRQPGAVVYLRPSAAARRRRARNSQRRTTFRTLSPLDWRRYGAPALFLVLLGPPGLSARLKQPFASCGASSIVHLRDTPRFCRGSGSGPQG